MFLLVGLIGGLLVGDYGPLFHRHDARINRLTWERDSLNAAKREQYLHFQARLMAAEQRTDFFRGMSDYHRRAVRTLVDSVVTVVHDTVRPAEAVLADLRPMVLQLRDSVEYLNTLRDSVEAMHVEQIQILTQRIGSLDSLALALDQRLGEALAGWRQATKRCRFLTLGAGPNVNPQGAGIGASLNVVSCDLR